jgi:hypothetical protein
LSSVLISRNSFKIQKFIENRIKFIKMQTKFHWNYFE